MNISLFGRPVLASAMIPRVFSGLVAHTLAKFIRDHGGVTADQEQSNGMWAVHQFRVVLPGDTTAYRIIVAPANAPVFIGEVSADLHFAEPLKAVDAMEMRMRMAAAE